ncbi:amino acid adenylation domain-containing protein [Nocardiopsis alkaliphila]|uniref:amino acid adenylation domain-containing protein n=1 Tax=Nocardiopsis alkaliphila TaxID=225762 RepID=UPI001378B67D|nr:non-ribosomal peptide synthetase [Nocardiopsis alkaliphila]
MSFAQRRLWLMERMGASGPVYNVSTVLRLRGVLDSMALRSAMGDLVERHEVLRTLIESHDGEPFQNVLPVGEALELLEFQEECCARSEAATLVAQTNQSVFDLSADLPLRVRLLRVAPQETILVVLVHHIATDGWSEGVLLEDLRAAYEARVEGGAPVWEPLPVQYADYALWQRDLLGDAEDPESLLTGHLRFWRSALEGVPEVSPLPLDRPRSVNPSQRGGRHVFRIEPALRNRLHELARAHGCTLFMALQAAIAVTLQRSGAGEDVVLGTPVAGRTDPALDRLMGFFVNTLVLRTDLSGEPTFETLLERVREADLEAFDHQEMPFDLLVEELNPDRSSAHHPIFQVMMILQNNETAELSLPGLDITPEPFTWDTAKFDLTFAFAEVGEELNAVVDYATDLFDLDTVRGLAERLNRVLSHVTENPERPVADIELLTAREVQEAVVTANDTAAGHPERLVHRVFEEIAAERPEAVALVFEGRRITYRELDQRADRFAKVLRSNGVLPGSLVGVLLERGELLAVALLAVLKAGAGYVPLDPDFPDARLVSMITTAGAVHVVTREGLSERALGSWDRVLVDLEPGDAATAVESDTGDLAVEVPAHSIACVMFTSGSTGVPKGVAASHTAIISTFTGQEYFSREAGRIWLQSAPVSWDAFVLEFWGALLHGGVCVLQPGQAPELPRMVELADQYRTDTFFLSATLFNVAVDEYPRLFAHARQVYTGGERASVEHMRRFRSDHPHVRLHNGYGPVESMVFTHHHPVEEVTADSDSVPIGGLLRNRRCYVLDERLRPVPTGVPGELYVAGDGLAHGYLGRTSLTSERFVPDPFGPSGSRMYRTGDIVRAGSPDRFEYLGRSDDQVKIRGFRIEPGELQAAVTALPGVAQAVVTADEDHTGVLRLVVYAVPAAGHEIVPTGIRSSLTATLPSHMVPSAVVVLDALPIGANGKLDRRSLPRPDFDAFTHEFRAPRNPREEILCGLFTAVLGLERVGVDDSFFDLGGHSLLATRLLARIRSVLGVDMSLRALFEAPTVSGLARVIESEEHTTTRPSVFSMDRPDRLPLSFAQRRLWFLHQVEGQERAYNIQTVIPLKETPDPEAWALALRDVVERHEALRTVFPASQGEPHQLVTDGSDVVLQVRDCPVRDAPEVLRDIDAHVFDLENGPLLRADLLVDDTGGGALVLLMHHIVGDGWSLAPLTKDLERAYAARKRGIASDQRPLPVQYADYTLWQRELLGEVTDPDSLFAIQTRFWTDTLSGLPEVTQWPLDFPRPAEARYEGHTVTAIVDEETHQGLVRVAREHDCTLFMVIHAALVTVLSRMGVGEDLAIGTPVAGRTDPALDDLVGFFVNTLVLRTDVSGNPTLSGLLASVRETDLAAFDHQDIPFEQVVEAVNPVRSNAYHPLFQAMLSLVTDEVSGGEEGDEQSSYRRADVDTAKFDLDFTYGGHTAGAGSPAVVSLEYATDLFEEDTARALLERLITVMRLFGEDMDHRLNELDVLTADEDPRRQTDPVPDQRPRAGFLDRFEEQVLLRPDHVAIVHRGLSLSYAELGARADRLAHILHTAGYGDGRPIPLLMDRTDEHLTALLALLKIGAPYLPLDPRHPAARLADIVQEAGARLVITDDERLGNEVRTETDAVVAVERFEDLLARPVPSVRGPLPDPGPNAPAYLVYTSGSTGRPKGVLVGRDHLAYLMEALEEVGYYLDEPAVSAWTANPAFDASVQQWGPICRGDTVLVVDDPTRDDPKALAEELRRHKVTYLDLTPTFWEMSRESLVSVPDSKSRLRLTMGGEACGAQIWEELAAAEYIDAFNTYGPTETTVEVTVTPIQGAYPHIGHPLPGIRAYVLDEGLRPLPTGVIGELYIAGEGVSLGYLGRSDLTSGRFLPDPFGAPGSRMYRTGDRVSRGVREELRYHGRSDDQVKIRGLRIEPGEIAAVLAGHPGVSSAVVVVREDRPGDPRLVAYVIAETGREAEPRALRAHAARSLPEYMVPAAIEVVEAFPLNPNGKLDQSALPVPRYTPTKVGRPPSNAREAALCALFAEVLGLGRVGVDDSFFDLGGHSLLAARLVGRAEAELGLQIKVRDVFRAPTVVGLLAEAPALESAGKGALDVLLPLNTGGSRPPLFCVHPGMGMAWCYSGLVRHLGEDQPLYGLQTRAFTTPGALPDSVAEIAEEYLDRVRTVAPHGPYRLLGWSFGGLVAHEMAVRLQAVGEEVELLGLMDSYPVPPGAERTDFTQSEVLGMMLDAPVPPDLGGDLSRAAVVRELRAQDPVLAGFEEPDLFTLVGAAINHAVVMNRHTPGVFTGDTIFLRASHGRSQDSTRVESWNAHIDGRVDVHEIDATHMGMARPEPLAAIGRLLSAHIEHNPFEQLRSRS